MSTRPEELPTLHTCQVLSPVDSAGKKNRAGRITITYVFYQCDKSYKILLNGYVDGNCEWNIHCGKNSLDELLDTIGKLAREEIGIVQALDQVLAKTGEYFLIDADDTISFPHSTSTNNTRGYWFPLEELQTYLLQSLEFSFMAPRRLCCQEVIQNTIHQGHHYQEVLCEDGEKYPGLRIVSGGKGDTLIAFHGDAEDIESLGRDLCSTEPWKRVEIYTDGCIWKDLAVTERDGVLFLSGFVDRDFDDGRANFLIGSESLKSFNNLLRGIFVDIANE